MRYGVTKRFWIAALLGAMLLLFSSPALQAANEIVVFFPETSFILGTGSSDMAFTATIENSSSFSSSASLLMMRIQHATNPSIYNEVTATLIRQGVYGFSGTVPATTGTYNVTYYSKAGAGGVELTPSPNTPKQLKVHYRASATVTPAAPQLHEYDVEISGWIYDKADRPVTDVPPRIEVQGATVYSSTITNGQFTLKLNQITVSGKEALKLLFDGVVVASWDVSAGPFAAVSVSPGSLLVDTPQGLTIMAMSNDQGTGTSIVNNLRNLDNSSLTVELSGVPIYVDSVQRYDSGSIEYTDSYYRDTYKKVAMSGYDLSYNQLRFAESGKLQIKISASDGRYTSIVEIPVEYGSATGLLGAPAYQSYAGDTEIDLQFDTSGNIQISEYIASVSVNNGEPVSLSEKSSSGNLYRIKPITFSANGTGSVAVNVTTIDRNLESRDWSREFAFARPSLELSQTEIQLGEEVQLSVFLRDAEGNAINNGWVTIEGIGGRSANANGEYIFKATWNSGGYRRIQAFAADGSLLADFAQLLKVQVPEVLTLIPDTEVLIAGASQTIKARVIDENGREITGARIAAYIDNATSPSYFTWNGKEYSLTLNPVNKVVLQAMSSDGRKASPQVEVSVAKPIVTCNVTSLTANFMDHLEFTISHPVTKEPLSGTIILRTQNLQIAERNVSSNTTSSSASANKTGSRISLDLYNRPLSGTSEPKLIVDFTYMGRTYSEILSLPVGEVSVSVTPEALRQGVTEKITISVNSASDKPIAGLNVELRGTSQTGEGVTNDNGQASFNIKPSSSATSYTFVIERTDRYVQTGQVPSTMSVEVPVTGDTTPPVLSITNLGESSSAETDQEMFALDFDLRDDFALDALFINGERIDLEGDAVQRQEVFQLSEGDNLISIELTDKAGHPVSRDIVVHYTKPEQPDPSSQPIILTIGSSVVKQGDLTLTFPPLPPQVINGRSMLPFRYLVQDLLSGMVNYEEETRRITAYVNGHEIIMVVDDPVIYVDGVRVELDQAPIVQNGSTLAPLRAFERAVSALVWQGETQTVEIYP